MEDKPLPYKSSKLLTPTEESFFKILNNIVGNQYNISLKTRLIDLLKIIAPEDTKEYLIAKSKVIQKHLDFIISDKNNPSIVKLVIELDDPSHNNKDRRKSDKIKNEILNKVNIPFLRIKVKEIYDITALEIAIRKRLEETSSISNKPIINWNKVKEESKKLFIEKGIPSIFAVVILFFILPKLVSNMFQNTLKNTQPMKTAPKNSIIIRPPPIPDSAPLYKNKNLVPIQPQMTKENIIIASPKIKVKVRIAGKYNSENKSYVMYERIDTRKQRNVTIEDFLKMCKCSATELYVDKLIEIVEYP